MPPTPPGRNNKLKMVSMLTTTRHRKFPFRKSRNSMTGNKKTLPSPDRPALLFPSYVARLGLTTTTLQGLLSSPATPMVRRLYYSLKPNAALTLTFLLFSRAYGDPTSGG